MWLNFAKNLWRDLNLSIGKPYTRLALLHKNSFETFFGSTYTLHSDVYNRKKKQDLKKNGTSESQIRSVGVVANFDTGVLFQDIFLHVTLTGLKK